MKQSTLALLAGLLMANGLFAQEQSPPATAVSQSAAATPAAGTPSAQELNLQAYVQLLRTDLNKNKSILIGDVMQFDAEQASIFWPIYKDFQTEYSKIGDRIVELVKDYVTNYASMTGDTAEKLAMKMLDIDQQRNDLKRKYFRRLKTALDPITAARFLQVENQIEKIVDLQISSQLPVVGGSGE